MERSSDAVAGPMPRREVMIFSAGRTDEESAELVRVENASVLVVLRLASEFDDARLRRLGRNFPWVLDGH
jgi:hypothetical protein